MEKTAAAALRLLVVAFVLAAPASALLLPPAPGLVPAGETNALGGQLDKASGG